MRVRAQTLCRLATVLACSGLPLLGKEVCVVQQGGGARPACTIAISRKSACTIMFGLEPHRALGALAVHLGARRVPRAAGHSLHRQHERPLGPDQGVLFRRGLRQDRDRPVRRARCSHCWRGPSGLRPVFRTDQHRARGRDAVVVGLTSPSPRFRSSPAALPSPRTTRGQSTAFSPSSLMSHPCRASLQCLRACQED